LHCTQEIDLSQKGSIQNREYAEFIKGGKMDQKEMLKQMIDFNKKAFDNTFNAWFFFRTSKKKWLTPCWSRPPGCPGRKEGRYRMDESL